MIVAVGALAQTETQLTQQSSKPEKLIVREHRNEFSHDAGVFGEDTLHHRFATVRQMNSGRASID